MLLKSDNIWCGQQGGHWGLQGAISCADARPPVAASTGPLTLAGIPSIRSFVAKSTNKLLADTKSFWSEEGLLRKAPCMSKLLFKNYLITFTFIRFQRTYDGFYQDVHIFAKKKESSFQAT